VVVHETFAKYSYAGLADALLAFFGDFESVEGLDALFKEFDELGGPH
jgi:hypothetical protein